MKKVEVYFLINLGAILSLFAIEGELAKYKRKQGDILLEVAKDKLEAMVDVNNINSLNSDSLYKFTFDLEGEYDKESVDVNAEFNLNDTTALNDELNLTAKAVMKEGSYVAEIPISQFETFQNKRFDVSLDIGFLPNISSSTIDDWTVIFGSDNIAKKIEDNINKKVSRDGAFRMTRDLDAAIVPVPLEGQKADFFVLFDKKRFTVLKGLKWEIPLTVGGVFSNSDFEVSISGGNEMISSIEQGTPRSKIIGNATSSGGSIEITGIRKKDSKVSIILLTAKGEVENRIKGLELGADDYLGKPFEPKELLLRIKNILAKKNKVDLKSYYNIGRAQVDLNKMTITLEEKIKKINNSEKKVLLEMLANPGTTYSRDENES